MISIGLFSSLADDQKFQLTLNKLAIHQSIAGRDSGHRFRLGYSQDVLSRNENVNTQIK
jgi:hypothetical protein